MTIDIHKFVLAGRAVFTITSLVTKTRYTYKVTKAQHKDLWFVRVLTGPDNYQYLGVIGIAPYHEYFHGTKSMISEDAPSVRAFKWFWKNHKTDLSAVMAFNHEGCCARCGRALTVPESIASGFGPICATK